MKNTNNTTPHSKVKFSSCIKNTIKKVFRPFYKWMCKKHVKYDLFMYHFMGNVRVHYYRQVLKECGSHLVINGKPFIHNPEQIHVGDYFTINSGAQICPRGDVYIGNYVTMSRGSQITAGQLDLDLWMEEQNQVHSHVSKPVYIADGTWLCINSVVLPGVSIKGKGCIVAAGAVVTQDIEEDYVVVGGVPAKIIRRLNKQNI